MQLVVKIILHEFLVEFVAMMQSRSQWTEAGAFLYDQYSPFTTYQSIFETVSPLFILRQIALSIQGKFHTIPQDAFGKVEKHGRAGE